MTNKACESDNSIDSSSFQALRFVHKIFRAHPIGKPSMHLGNSFTNLQAQHWDILSCNPSTRLRLRFNTSKHKYAPLEAFKGLQQCSSSFKSLPFFILISVSTILLLHC